MNFASESLLTDLYQLTMMQAYHHEKMHDVSVFEFFVREQQDRNFLIAAGLEQVISYIQNIKFTDDDLRYLKTLNLFSDDFLESLKSFRFTGDINAMPEGTIFFANEPILQIIAPLPQAQLLESRIINLLQFQTMIASKAIRSRLVAPKKLLIDFGMRRAHGSEAAILAARANYLAGLDGTATVLAGKLFDIPVYGTMAHSYIQAHQHEEDAFLNFAKIFPDQSILLIDTYDVMAAIDKIIALIQQQKIKVNAVRIDSGDLKTISKQVRAKLDNANLSAIKIFVSGDLDEYRLQTLADAPIDGFGIGTKLDTSADRPYLNCAYKLEEYQDIPTCKFSPSKTTLPGKKQVIRTIKNNLMIEDEITLFQNQQGLLQAIMRQGKLIAPLPALKNIRQHVEKELQLLPENFKRLEMQQSAYPVKTSESLMKLQQELLIKR